MTKSTSVGHPDLFETMEIALSELAKMIDTNDLSKNPEAFREKALEFATQLKKQLLNGQAMHISVDIDEEWPDRQPDHWYPCLCIEYQRKEAKGMLVRARA